MGKPLAAAVAAALCLATTAGASAQTATPTSSSSPSSPSTTNDTALNGKGESTPASTSISPWNTSSGMTQWQLDNPIGKELRALRDEGVNFSLDSFTDNVANPVGGVKQGAQTSGWIDYGADFDLAKLAGVANTRVHLQGAWFYGENLNQRDIGNSLYVQQSIRPVKGVFLTQMNIEHDFLNDKLNVMVGRAALNTYFASSPLNCLFATNVLCLTGYGPIQNMGITGFPYSSWAAKFRYAFTDRIYLQTGAFDYNPTLSLAGKGGVDFSLGQGQGVMLPVEVGYETNPANDRFPRRYRAGIYFNTNGGTSPYYDINGVSAALAGKPRAAEDGKRAAFYAIGDQVVTPPDPLHHRNLTLLARAYINAGDVQTADSFAAIGAVKTGTFPGRDLDTIGVLFTSASFSSEELSYLRDIRSQAGGFGTPDRHEFLGEINYGFVPVRGLRFFPNIQYIINPDPISMPTTRGNIPNALVVGLRIDILAGQLFGVSPK